jgi:hypothetical protein
MLLTLVTARCGQRCDPIEIKAGSEIGLAFFNFFISNRRHSVAKLQNDAYS